MNRLVEWMDRQPLRWPRLALYLLAANAVVAATYYLGTVFRMARGGR